MSTHSKKKKTSIEGGMKTTTYENLKSNQGGATGRFGGMDSPGMNPSKNTPKKKKKKKKPTVFGMSAKDIKNKFKKSYGGA
tara:strand:+ start:280 stop:522 length:243 start_codon:yes stop_codon:yes gene_type:complete